jgi:uncharacterized protein (TIGR02996 family)
MSGEREAFLAAIATAPDDDTPRLVFADWLDEQGTEDDRARAALIRAQCQAELLPTGSKERKKLEAEARAILKKHSRKWTQELRAAKFGTGLKFRRGFLDEISMSPTRFVQDGAKLFALAPTLRTAKFPYAQSEVTPLTKSPYLARLASVDLTLMCTCGMCPIDVELRNLFKSEYAANLRCLNISRDRIDEGMARALAKSPVLTKLRTLDLSDNPLGIEGLRALLKSPHIARLTALTLARTGLQNAGAELLAATEFKALTQLDLTANNIRADGAKALVAAPFFNQLTVLNLSHNRIAEAGARALVAAAPDSKLEELDLCGTRLGPRAAQLLKDAFGKRVKLD